MIETLDRDKLGRVEIRAQWIYDDGEDPHADAGPTLELLLEGGQPVPKAVGRAKRWLGRNRPADRSEGFWYARIQVGTWVGENFYDADWGEIFDAGWEPDDGQGWYGHLDGGKITWERA